VYRFTNDVLKTDDQSNDYDERRKGGSATISRPMGKNGRGAFTLRSESIDSSLQSSQILSSNGNVTSGTTRYTRSNRDSEVEPFHGTYMSYAVEIGDANFNEPGIVGGLDKNKIFSKYSTDIRLYLSKGGPRKELNEKRKVLALRLMSGNLSGNVPFFEQYFLGGAESLRGYKEDRFWGKSMLLASAELRIPVAQSLIGVIFADAGDAWGARDIYRDPDNPAIEGDPFKKLLINQPQHENFSPSIGYGLGIRVATPIGPLRLDYGFGSEGPRAHFSIGHVF
ncbi:MAG: BamA/TamA family outer membrane protein, partial [Armatimonadota bacterium]